MRRATKPDAVRLVRDGASGVEAIRARFSGHAYDPHRHEEWLVGVTDWGLQDFFCRGARRLSTAGRLILMEPGELHDGRAGGEDGFGYSMLSLPQGWVQACLGEAPAGFRQTLGDDERLAGAIRRACALLDAPANPGGRLARDAALDAVLSGLRRHFGLGEDQGAAADPAVARRARDRLHALLAEGDDLGADALAEAAGVGDRFRLARAFRAAYGTPPHAYLVQIRLTEARRLLTAGERPAAVAAACGFADQSHLGRWFRRAYGVTPAAYRACCTGVPDAAGSRR